MQADEPRQNKHEYQTGQGRRRATWGLRGWHRRICRGCPVTSGGQEITGTGVFSRQSWITSPPTDWDIQYSGCKIKR